MYRIKITELVAKHVKPLEDAFKDREIEIYTEHHPMTEYDVYDVTISNVHPITMTPLMWWILHHIDKSDYYDIIIS